MIFEEIEIAWRIYASSLRAVTAIDRIRRNVDDDVAPIIAFVEEMETVYGAAPSSVRDAISKRDGQFLERLQAMCFDIHEAAHPWRSKGPFSDDEFDTLMAQSVPLSADLIARIDALVGDIDVDLDEPIIGDVTL